MTIFHDIHLSEIRRGDHLYVREGFLRRVRSEGIIISGSDVNRNEQWLVIVIKHLAKKKNSNAELRLLTLTKFMKPDLKLRLVLYDQGDVLLHHLKLSGTSYVEPRMLSDVIVNNALAIYKASRSPHTNKEHLKALIGDKYERFSYICSTTEWRNWTLPIDLHSLNHRLPSSNTLIVPIQSTSLPALERMPSKAPNEKQITGL
jgi:hypothetical protein